MPNRIQPLKRSSGNVRRGGRSLRSSWSRGQGVLGGGGGEGRMSFRRFGCLWKLLARWLRCRVVDVGKLQVLGRVGLHVSLWVVPKPSRPGLANKGSLGVPIPGDDITFWSSAHKYQSQLVSFTCKIS